MFDEGTFRPTAKITSEQAYTIITDYLGTPVAMHDQYGFKEWSARLDIYGKVANFEGAKGFTVTSCPFRYQGQYEDAETGLYYNRFRYYSPEEGLYLSQDPIGLEGGNPTLYGYVQDPNWWVDAWGLRCTPSKRAAFRQAKRDAGIPMSQQPNKVDKVMMTDKGGNPILGSNKKPIMTKEYHYTNNKGENIIIQDHSAGHKYPGGKGNQDAHYNVRPAENPRTGKVSGTKEHYPFK